MLYEVVRDHLETCLANAAASRNDAGLPRLIEREFRDFLSCGQLAGGFARLRCKGRGTDRLLPFSCKRRTVCGSCGGRRMAERAAHLVEHVFPDVPVRHWVVSLPYRLCSQLAGLCRVRDYAGLPRRSARSPAIGRSETPHSHSPSRNVRRRSLAVKRTGAGAGS